MFWGLLDWVQRNPIKAFFGGKWPLFGDGSRFVGCTLCVVSASHRVKPCWQRLKTEQLANSVIALMHHWWVPGSLLPATKEYSIHSSSYMGTMRSFELQMTQQLQILLVLQNHGYIVAWIPLTQVL